jgi:hypothetical protein
MCQINQCDTFPPHPHLRLSRLKFLRAQVHFPDWWPYDPPTQSNPADPNQRSGTIAQLTQRNNKLLLIFRFPHPLSTLSLHLTPSPSHTFATMGYHTPSPFFVERLCFFLPSDRPP